MAVGSLVVAVCALLFTVASFWWLQARTGSVVCFPVQTFAGYVAADRAAIRLPLALFNNGAAPIVIVDLRLLLKPETGPDLVMRFTTVRKSLRPEPDDVQDFAHPFCVRGRSVVQVHAEFTADGPTALLTGASVTACVEARLGQAAGWVSVGSMPLHVEGMSSPGSYITYPNDPADR